MRFSVIAAYWSAIHSLKMIEKQHIDYLVDDSTLSNKISA